MSSIEDNRSALIERGYVLLEEGASAEDLFDGRGRLGAARALHAIDHGDARSWSLSGRFGRGAFPWHTDGAISSFPPRWLMLHPLVLSAPTTTELLDPDVALRRRLHRTALLARDHVGRGRYLPALVPTDGGDRLRWDPRTCRPVLADVLAQVEESAPTAVIEWLLGRTLVVDNFRLLHRRPAVTAIASRVLERTYVWSQ